MVKPVYKVNILNDLVSNYKRIGVILDGNCNETGQLLIRCARYKVFDARHFWLVLFNSENFMDIFQKVNLNVDCEVKVALPVPGHNKYLIKTIYNPAYGKGGELKVSKIGIYDIDNGYQVNGIDNKYFKRRNFTGVHFNSAIVLAEKYERSLENYLITDKDKQVDTLNRYHARLMRHCRDYYNFTVKMTVVKSWGFFKTDGTMDGVVGELERKRADFGSTPLIAKKERVQFITYGRNAWPLRMAFLLRNPNSKKSYQIFTKPLSFDVWMCIVCSALLLVFVQKLGFKFDHELNKYVDTSWSITTVYTLGAFCQQGITIFPQCISGRMAALITLLLGSLIYQFYSAILVSFLLNVPVSVIKTVEEILENGFEIGFENVLYATSLLKAATSKTSQDLRKILSAHNNSGFLDRDTGMNYVKRGHYAFHVELVTAYPFMEKNFDASMICDLKTIPLFQPMYMYANYQKWSPFKDVMDVCLQRLGENGVIARELLFWQPRKPECMRSASTITFNTGLEDFYPALVILAMGMTLSMFILFLEILHHRI
ncbi:hypothetical protein ABEB36_002965 [Hypothenemus hampei]|uniref:Uncharacterized protein n=1 Tax=Hypothenemus hampei TaxID=57062 RepID=A0ABD1F7Y5_HYPHA